MVFSKVISLLPFSSTLTEDEAFSMPKLSPPLWPNRND
jgi:hypothetical protein